MIGGMKIPLFPLDLVLFPGVPLPLHIFEPRYREMIAECIADNAPFGVVRAQRDGLAVVGCTAQVVRQATPMMLFGHLWIHRVDGQLRIEWLGVNRNYKLLITERET